MNVLYWNLGIHLLLFTINVSENYLWMSFLLLHLPPLTNGPIIDRYACDIIAMVHY